MIFKEQKKCRKLQIAEQGLILKVTLKSTMGFFRNR